MGNPSGLNAYFLATNVPPMSSGRYPQSVGEDIRPCAIHVGRERWTAIIAAVPPHTIPMAVHDLAIIESYGPAVRPGILIVDLELLWSSESERQLNDAIDIGWQVVADCAFSQRGIQALVRFAHLGLCGVLLRNEGPDRHVEELRRLAPGRAVLLLLGALAPIAPRLKPQLQIAIVAMCCGGNRIGTVTEFARVAGRSRRWIEENLTSGGLYSASSLINAALIARAYTALVDPMLSLRDAAVLAGLGTPRTIKRQIQLLARVDIDSVRSGMSAPELVARIMRGITTTH